MEAYFYIGVITGIGKTREEIMSNFESYKDISFSELNKMGVFLLSSIPTMDGKISYLVDENERALKYLDVYDLIDDYFIGYDDRNFSKKVSLNKQRKKLFMEKFIIIEKYNNRYNFFSDAETEINIDFYNKFNTSLENEIIEQVKEADEFHLNNIKSFTDYIESYIEKDYAYLVMSSDLSDYKVHIVREGSPQHKDMEVNGNFTKSEGGWLYSSTYEEFENYLIHNTIAGVNVGCDFRVSISDYGKINSYKKAYTLCILHNDFEVIHLDSKKTLYSHTTNTKTKKLNAYKPDKYIIYCGKDKNDIICGFNLI